VSVLIGTIQFRRDTAANWLLANPVLLDHEFGYETDTEKVKKGDGVTAWSLLDYNSDPAIAALAQDLATHESRTDNPHSVTAAQIGVAAGATANDTDANLKNRANHTGTQDIATISGLGDAAAKNTGTISGTVAAGDDTRIKGYPLVFNFAGFSPADGITYYLGNYYTLASGSGTLQNRRILPMKAGTITTCVIYIWNATLDGSAENATFSFVLNGVTDYVISNAVQFNAGAGGRTIVITGLSVPIVNPTTDYLTVKMVSPVWVTNPLNSFITVMAYLE
jgi:hypothetical protein